MDPRRKDKIKSEFRKAEEYLNGAEQLHRAGLYTPSTTMSYYSSYHAAAAAFLTVGFDNPHKEGFTGFMTVLKKFSAKLDPYIENLEKMKGEWGFNTALEYTENESLLRFYQSRDFVLEVKDFIRRAVKF